MRSRFMSLALTCVSFAALSCGGGGSDGPTAPPVPPASQRVVTSITYTAGAGQTARIGSSVPVSPVVSVKDQNGSQFSGVTVTFSVKSGGGTVTGGSAVTDASGLASVATWVLGPNVGENVLTATATGGSNPSADIIATARYPRWTYMVYLAADNNLALPGIGDIDEIEAAGIDPEVQVIIQAEFSPIHLALSGCGASCTGRSNFNTFRYVVNSQAPSVRGANGPTTDLGNRDMSDPLQLKEFVMWAKQTAPAERYAVVLWNHGGGYTGVISDETTSGGKMMSLPGLASALSGVGIIDILDFDMCLMAGYEVLASINTLAKYAVVSEAEIPGEGNPYTPIIDRLQGNPSADTRSLVEFMVEDFHASFNGHRSSTTRSGFDLATFAQFETALNALGNSLRTGLSTHADAISRSAANSQRFEYSELTDVGNWLDSLETIITDATIRSQIDAVQSQLLAESFRVRNRVRNGSDNDRLDVSRATGLNIVLPVGDDALADEGPQSFTAYSAALPNKAWTQFLAAWLATRATVDYVDQGDRRFEGFLVWDSAAVSRGADMDLWVLEPNGNLFIPFLGTVTPNGFLTNESDYDKTYYEGYQMKRVVQVGTYKFYAHLWADPNNFRPEFNFFWRYTPAPSYAPLYAINRRADKSRSVDADPTPTFGELEANAYSDLQYVAVLQLAASGSASMIPADAGALRPSMTLSDGGPSITRQQLEVFRQHRRLGRRRSARSQSTTTMKAPPPLTVRKP